MANNQIKIRRKTEKKNSMGKYILLTSVLVILIGFCLGIGFLTVFKDKYDFWSNETEVVIEGSSKIYKVFSGKALQEAINRSESGDIIQLEAGKTYSGIVLPDKPIKDYITIRTSAFNKLPENLRVNPNQANLMAKIVADNASQPAVSTKENAHHFRFIGIEFTTKTKEYVYNLIYLGEPNGKNTNIPHDFEFDRCYVHSNNESKTRRGIAVNGANIVVKNSYVEGFAYPQEETQGIAGWTGSKNIQILNNYVEGGAENIMFGGSDPSSADLVPSDIIIKNNFLYKPDDWKGKNTTKCLFELKNAKRVLVEGNLFENNFEGTAFRLTIRNQDGKAPFSTLEDVVIKNNVIKNADAGVNILGKDDTYQSQTMRNLIVTNNLWLNIKGLFLQISNGENIEISHNTVFNGGNIMIAYGAKTTGFKFFDNIVAHNDYGIHVEDFVKNAAEANSYFSPVVRKNIFVDTKNIGKMFLSENNFAVKNYNEIGFLNLAGNNFQLSNVSKFKGKSTDGKDLGCDILSIQKIMPKEMFERISK